MWPLIFPVALVVFLAVILIRAALFKPEKKEQQIVPPVYVNGEKATHDLCEMIKCKTISHRDVSLDDQAEFDKFEKLLPELFPQFLQSVNLRRLAIAAFSSDGRVKTLSLPAYLCLTTT